MNRMPPKTSVELRELAELGVRRKFRIRIRPKFVHTLHAGEIYFIGPTLWRFVGVSEALGCILLAPYVPDPTEARDITINTHGWRNASIIYKPPPTRVRRRRVCPNEGDD